MFLAFVGTGNYLRETWRGNTQPHRVTWGLWSLEGLLAFCVEVQQHVGISSLMTLVLGFVPLLVLVASFRNPHAVWKIDRVDIACGAVSLAGLIFWALGGADLLGPGERTHGGPRGLFGGRLHRRIPHPAQVVDHARE